VDGLLRRLPHSVPYVRIILSCSSPLGCYFVRIGQNPPLLITSYYFLLLLITSYYFLLLLITSYYFLLLLIKQPNVVTLFSTHFPRGVCIRSTVLYIHTLYYYFETSSPSLSPSPKASCSLSNHPSLLIAPMAGSIPKKALLNTNILFVWSDPKLAATDQVSPVLLVSTNFTISANFASLPNVQIDKLSTVPERLPHQEMIHRLLARLLI